MSNLENLARAIGEDVKAIKEDSELKDREVKKRLDTLESRPRVHPETLVTKAELEEKGYLTSTKTCLLMPKNGSCTMISPSRLGISALENRPSFDTLTQTQRDSLKGIMGIV